MEWIERNTWLLVTRQDAPAMSSTMKHPRSDQVPSRRDRDTKIMHPVDGLNDDAFWHGMPRRA